MILLSIDTDTVYCQVQQAALQYRSHVFGQVSPVPATDRTKIKAKLVTKPPEVSHFYQGQGQFK